MGSCLGYIAVVEDRKIEPYLNTVVRRKLLSKNHGKTVRYIDGKNVFLELERWLVVRTQSKYKVRNGESINYYTDERSAQGVANKIGGIVETVCDNKSKTKILDNCDNKIELENRINIPYLEC